MRCSPRSPRRRRRRCRAPALRRCPWPVRSLPHLSHRRGVRGFSVLRIVREPPGSRSPCRELICPGKSLGWDAFLSLKPWIDAGRGPGCATERGGGGFEAPTGGRRRPPARPAASQRNNRRPGARITCRTAVSGRAAPPRHGALVAVCAGAGACGSVGSAVTVSPSCVCLRGPDPGGGRGGGMRPRRRACAGGFSFSERHPGSV